ncbi:hypothetical protein GCK72_014029 [Caenorhabditis remanei]|uniref:MADF domain-containing protein n=1 Tax=Caenorhabditis remanei TaxID=31234 RepID=A0A6A5GSR1_CAERE|nr:hypothetical protein GCK72_014029 [Caenorhabditis remanei]KAF1757573.1 hypothetical protein GCK72_014029 [Caenorhabditis remanei]
MMLDPRKMEEFIEQVRLTPAIWRKKEFGVSREHLNEIWAHFGHTFDISAEEAEKQWDYLIRLHRFMNKEASKEKFRFGKSEDVDSWNDADSSVADALSSFLKTSLDELLLVSEPTETSV